MASQGILCTEGCESVYECNMTQWVPKRDGVHSTLYILKTIQESATEFWALKGVNRYIKGNMTQCVPERVGCMSPHSIENHPRAHWGWWVQLNNIAPGLWLTCSMHDAEWQLSHPVYIWSDNLINVHICELSQSQNLRYFRRICQTR